MKSFASILTAMLVTAGGITLIAPPTAAATTYYVSSSTGNDNNDGLAAQPDGTHGPWKTLAKASAVKFQPGDQLLLKCSDIWDETLTLSGSGTAENPVTVASYGTGERPYIHRTIGKGEECIVVKDSSGYCFRDLEVGFAWTGIHMRLDAKAKTDYDYYRFENCFLHDIDNPGFLSNDAAWGWALRWDGGGMPRNISIVHCIGLRTQGFSSGSAKGNVIFDANTISHGSLNQVYQSGAADFDITNCVFVYNYPWKYDRWGTTQVIAGGLKGGPNVRYDVINNEFGWPGDYPGSPDGCGYDFEVSTNDVTFQNNFVHDSYGEGVLFMGTRVQKSLIFDHNIFRNNVRFSPRWTSTISLPLSVTGSGVFSHNVFYLWPGTTAFGTIGQKNPTQKPTDFTYVDNDEHPTKPFVAMPLVARIDHGNGARTYTFACATPGATIRYTLDASLPTPSSPTYHQPITIKRSGILNVKAFKDGCYPSYVNSLAVELRTPGEGAPSAWWKLDERSGTTVKDSAGANDGTLEGATRTMGHVGQGLQFDGGYQWVNLKHTELAAISNSFTLSFWAEPTGERTATPEAETGIGVPGTAWWKMDEGNGIVLADSAGDARGHLNNCTWTDGKFGSGLQFNGTNSSVNLPISGLAATTDTFTLSFWADPEAPRSSTDEATTGITGLKGQQFALAPQQYSEASGEAGVGVSVGTNGISTFELADNHMPSPLVYDHAVQGWTHIAVVYRDKQPTLYVNGVLAKTGLKSDKTVHPAFHFGGDPYGWYQGKLDDVRVYPRALTETEIRQLTEQGEAASIPWTLDNTKGTASLPYALAPVSRGGGSDAGNAGVGVAVGTNGVSVCEASDAYLPTVLVDSLPLTGWNHIAVVYQDGQPTLYINGIFEKAGCRSTKTVQPVFNIGGGPGLGSYRGKLDDVRVYNRALTDAEVQEIASEK